MKKGFIKRLIANQYTLIDLETKEEVIAFARGKLRYMKLNEANSFNRQLTKRTKLDPKIMKVSPKVGDYVIYDDSEDQVLITEILPRKNDLVRPDVCNIDQVLLVFSAVNPDFSFHLLDKFLIILNQENLVPVIVISKIDLIEIQSLEALKRDMFYYEKIGYKIYYVNSKQQIGIDVLAHIFTDKLTVLAGQTGVGKSTLLNALMPELKLKTQEISKALGRGKHTTRHTELYEYNGGYIVDTPGFSKIEFLIFHADEVKTLYPDFVELSTQCRFKSNCMHLNEPDCAVKKAVENGEILASRYENYVQFCEEVKNQKDKY
ncbi:MAG: ribosome small subunit-dependent GTPase A [Acholeplasmataceae bacterium]|nr:ribosome small subunit-dependent GTPase A [Acholeplasmataceae bacterium]